MKLNKLAFAVTTLLVSGAAWSHGYLLDPPARALLCNKIKETHDKNYPTEKMNTGCGNIQYEPQSMERGKGYPLGELLDGMIASANSVRGPELDAQSEARWNKTPMSAGEHQFTWYFTTPHPTTKYEYFITKNDWNPNQALSRASFESTPFCTVSRNGERPGQTDSHTCNVPAREGYQAILAVWTVNDTSAAFYNIADVEFSGSNIGGGDDGSHEQQHKPVIHFAQNKIVVEKNSANAAYAMDASNTQYANNYIWEVVEGFDKFQLQEKHAAPTTRRLEGPNITAPRAWVKGDHTGTATYRLTATNDFGSVSKDIQVEVKDSIPQGSAWVVGHQYFAGDTVTHNGQTYKCLNDNKSQSDWAPGAAHSLWQLVK